MLYFLCYAWREKVLLLYIVDLTVKYWSFQVTTLVNHPRKKGPRIGKSKNAHKLAQEIEDATVGLIQAGEKIAQDYPEIKDEILAACKECRGEGNSRALYLDPCLFLALSILIDVLYYMWVITVRDPAGSILSHGITNHINTYFHAQSCHSQIL